MANNYFLRKVACDELMDTLFFSTGNRPTKTKSPDSTTLSVDNITVVVRHNKMVIVRFKKETFTLFHDATQF